MTKKEKLILGSIPSVAGLAGAGLGYREVSLALRLAKMNRAQFARFLRRVPSSQKARYRELWKFGRILLRGRTNILKAKHVGKRGATFALPALAATALALLLLRGRERR